MRLLDKLDKIMSGIKPFIDARTTSPINAAQETKPLYTPATFAKSLAENDSVLKTLASNVTAAADADPQIDSRRIFKQEIEQVDKQKLSKTADKTVRVVFSKPAERMSYDDYTRDYLRAMLRESGVSKASDAEINRFQSLLKDATGGDGFGVEDKGEQAKMTERYRTAQTAKGGGEAYWGTSPQARAQVLAGAGAILRERAVAGAQLGAAQTIGQQKATDMATDIPKVFVRAAINTAEGAANMAIEVADPSIKTDPHNWTRAKIGDIMDSQLPPPRNGARQTELARVNADPIRPEYKSDVFNRDVLTGKVNKDGLTVGKLTETGVELAAPVVVGKVFSAAKVPQGLELSKPSFGRVTPLGGRAVGDISRREYDPDKIGIPIRNLSTENIKVTHRGIDFVEKHLSRFPADKANQVMVKRLRDITDGKIPATQQDLNFYSHELRESMRYKRLGFPTGKPSNLDERHELWNNAHTSTLEDYKIKEKNSLTKDPLYHPDAAKFFYEDYK